VASSTWDISSNYIDAFTHDVKDVCQQQHVLKPIHTSCHFAGFNNLRVVRNTQQIAGHVGRLAPLASQPV